MQLYDFSGYFLVLVKARLRTVLATFTAHGSSLIKAPIQEPVSQFSSQGDALEYDN